MRVQLTNMLACDKLDVANYKNKGIENVGVL